MNAENFNRMYKESRPPEVRALYAMTTPETALEPRLNAAIELAARGFLICHPIEVQGCDPYTTMINASRWGFTSIPSLFMPPIGNETMGMYRNGVPPGAVKVSLDPTDYPAFDLPAPVVDGAPVRLGERVSESVYGLAHGDTSPIGYRYIGPEGEFVKEGTPWMGTFIHAHWTRVA